MNKLTIPSILAATVLIAGIFAFMPVEKASTVHVTIGEKIDTIGTEVADMKTAVETMQTDVGDIKTGIWTPINRTLTLTDDAADQSDVYTLTCPSTGYRLMGINAAVMGTTGATFTLSQVGNGFTGEIIVSDAGDDDDLTGDSIGMVTNEDLVITVGGDVTTGDDAVVKVTIQAPLTAVCSLTETT